MKRWDRPPDPSSGHWRIGLQNLRVVLRPLYDTHTGRLVACVPEFGADGSVVTDVAVAADREHMGYVFRRGLVAKVLDRLVRLPLAEPVRLFWPLAEGFAAEEDHLPDAVLGGFYETKLSLEGLVVVLGRRDKVRDAEFLKGLRGKGVRLAWEGFGAGFVDSDLWDGWVPDFAILSPELTEGLGGDGRRRTVCEAVMRLLGILGVSAVNDRVAEERDWLASKDLGFAMVGGPFFRTAEDVPRLFVPPPRDRRREERGPGRIADEVRLDEPVRIDADIREVLDRFRREPERFFFPVVDATHGAVGILHERHLKRYIYSPYGSDVLRNQTVGGSLMRFVTPQPTADIHEDEDRVVERFLAHPNATCVLVTEAGRYRGVLTASSLFRILNEKRIEDAKQMNPLTGLPGNVRIEREIAAACCSDRTVWLVHFDFDHFKPFNDTFGFRQGDRALLLFADILRELLGGRWFLGHIGGDDFFASCEGGEGDEEGRMAEVRSVLRKFGEDMVAFYPEEVRRQGFYMGRDRSGAVRRQSLLQVSAAVLRLAGPGGLGRDELALRLAELKKEAKAAGDGVAFRRLERVRSLTA